MRGQAAAAAAGRTLKTIGAQSVRKTKPQLKLQLKLTFNGENKIANKWQLQLQLRRCRQLNLELQSVLPELKSPLGQLASGFLLFAELGFVSVSVCQLPLHVCAEPASGLRQQLKRQSVPLPVSLTVCLPVCHSVSYTVSIQICLSCLSLALLPFLAIFFTPALNGGASTPANPTPSQALQCETRDDTRHTIVPSHSKLPSRVISN